MNGPYLAPVVITGSRSWTDVSAIHTALEDAWHAAREDGWPGIEVIEGGASGADDIAGRWADEHEADGVGHQRVDADWATCADDCPPGHRRSAHGATYCPTAGHRRNAAMVALQPALVIAFIAPCASNRCAKPKPHDSHGTAQCLGLARKAGIPIQGVRAP